MLAEMPFYVLLFGFQNEKHIHFFACPEKKWIFGKMQQSLGYELDDIGCGTGILIRVDRSLSHSMLRVFLASGLNDREILRWQKNIQIRNWIE